MGNSAARAAQSGPVATRRLSANITPGAVTNGTVLYVDFAFADAEVGDGVSVSFDDDLVAGILAGQPTVHAAGHVRIPFTNVTGAPVTQVQVKANVTIDKQL